MRLVRSEQVRILDIGCGFGSPSMFKRFCPGCEYHGLDRSEEWLLPQDKAQMQRFYTADLEKDTLEAVPGEFFDAIVISHVIEHLSNAENCLPQLARKLKHGGVIYIEWPGIGSLQVPHAKTGFMHFHDDPTHVRLYSVGEVSNIVLRSGCKIIRAGTRRDPLRFMLSPVLALRALILKRDMWSGRLWDFFGIAEFVVARRT